MDKNMPDVETETAALHEADAHTRQFQAIASWVVVVILIGFGTYALMKLVSVHETAGTYWQDMIREQFPVLVGLPMAGLGALFVTLILRISTGPLEFEMAGVKFKGGAAPIVFWIICFLSIVLSIRMLWQR
jgi:hypothetical protein